MNLSKMKLEKGFCHITEDGYKSMLAACRKVRHRLLIQLLWVYGLRISEVLLLRGKDVDMKLMKIKVRRLKKKTKTYSILDLPNSLAGEISIRTSGQRPHEKLIGITRQAAWAAVRSIAKRADVTMEALDTNGRSLNDVYCHAFRHGRAYDLASKGFDGVFIAHFLGHADLSTTLRYIHPQRRDIKAMVEA